MMSDLPIMNNSDFEIVPENSVLSVRAPRNLIIEFLLHVFTFGIYTSYWLFRRTQEFNRIHGETYTPWLWIFVPLVAIVQIFALPKLVSSINKLEIQSGLPVWNAWGGTWYIFLLGESIGFAISNKYEFPSYVYIIMFVIWGLLFVTLQHRIDSALRKITEYRQVKQKYIFDMPEFVILIIMFPIAVFGYIGIISKISFANAIREFQSNTVHRDQSLGFAIPIFGKDWKQVEIGSRSDGTTVFEMEGATESMYFVVFANSNEHTFNSVVYSRLGSMYEKNEKNCSQVRVLNKNNSRVIAKLVCESRLGNDFSIVVSTISETKDGRTLELYGEFVSPINSYNMHAGNFKKIADGFNSL